MSFEANGGRLDAFFRILNKCKMLSIRITYNEIVLSKLSIKGIKYSGK